MKIGVVGIGYVGLVDAVCLAEVGHFVTCVDTDEKKIAALKEGIVPIYEPGLEELLKHNIQAGRLTFTTELKTAVDNSLIIFIAVGTPPASDGRADTSAVFSVASKIAECMTDYRIVVTKSTVPVGTHKKVIDIMAKITEKPFDYVSNPEFLKEGSAIDDFMKPDRVIIGTKNPAVMEIMKQIFAPFMRKSSRMIFMDPASAEITKYAANTMLASRISFMNEISVLCDKCGADIESVRQGVGSDERIGTAFLFPGVGYGGSCFPKDVQALIKIGEENGCKMRIAHAAQEANFAQQDGFADKVLKYFENGKNVRLGVWGLAFKAKTNDTREAPATRCMKKFLERGMQISAYDPEAQLDTEIKDRVTMSGSSYDAIKDADALVIFTDWQEFRAPDFDIMAKVMKCKVIFDGRNLYDPNWVRKQGFTYLSIGRTGVNL